MRIILLLVIGILLGGVNIASAVQSVPAAPKPPCKISAIIEKVEFTDAKKREGNMDMCDELIPARYQMYVMINNVVADDPEIAGLCQELYPVGIPQILTLLTGGREMAFSFEKGQIVEGYIQYYGDECEHGLYLKEDFKLVNGENVVGDEDKVERKYNASDEIIFPAQGQHKSIWDRFIDWIRGLFK